MIVNRTNINDIDVGRMLWMSDQASLFSRWNEEGPAAFARCQRQYQYRVACEKNDRTELAMHMQAMDLTRSPTEFRMVKVRNKEVERAEE